MEAFSCLIKLCSCWTELIRSDIHSISEVFRDVVDNLLCLAVMPVTMQSLSLHYSDVFDMLDEPLFCCLLLVKMLGCSTSVSDVFELAV